MSSGDSKEECGAMGGIGWDGRVVCRELEEGWQTRLIVAKIIGEVGVIGEIEAMAKQLSVDGVRNVRLCLAAAVKNRPWFVQLFEKADDHESLFL
jgi:hypothetical protein